MCVDKFPGTLKNSPSAAIKDKLTDLCLKIKNAKSDEANDTAS
jgi:hypothetical protein